MKLAIRRAWRWLFRPANVVRCRRLSRSWHDKDHLMLNVCFQLLEDFVEHERPWELSGADVYADVLKEYSESGWPEVAEERAKSWAELKELYEWWKAYAPEDSLDEEEYAMQSAKLKQLIDLRGCLWT